MQHRSYTRTLKIKTQTCGHFDAEAAARLARHPLTGRFELDVT